MVDGAVGGKGATMLLDTGASLRLVPLELADVTEYTGKKRTMMGATGPGTFPTLNTTIHVGEQKARMTVLVKEGLQQPLLGRHFPEFCQLLLESVQKKEKTTKCLAEESPPEPISTPVTAVQTRPRRQLERQIREDDDLASAASGAIPQDLSLMDDSLFSKSKSRKKLSRREKKTQIRAHKNTSEPMQDFGRTHTHGPTGSSGRR